jgi:hypothetical protein
MSWVRLYCLLLASLLLLGLLFLQSVISGIPAFAGPPYAVGVCDVYTVLSLLLLLIF